MREQREKMDVQQRIADGDAGSMRLIVVIAAAGDGGSGGGGVGSGYGSGDSGFDLNKDPHSGRKCQSIIF